MVAKKLAKSSPETVGQVTGAIAHDINNILGVIICNLGLLQELCSDRPDIGEFARDAMTAALQGSSLTQRLFTVAQRQKLLDAQAWAGRSWPLSSPAQQRPLEPPDQP
jgi:hypothetical protein